MSSSGLVAGPRLWLAAVCVLALIVAGSASVTSGLRARNDGALSVETDPAGAAVYVDGRFVGTWSRKNAKDEVTVTLEPFDRVDERWLPALEREVADIGRFEGRAARLAAL